MFSVNADKEPHEGPTRALPPPHLPPQCPPALLPAPPPAGNESHAGQVFTCIGALSLAGALHEVDQDLFCWWLCERQTQSGGLNGRPEKLQDVSSEWR